MLREHYTTKPQPQLLYLLLLNVSYKENTNACPSWLVPRDPATSSAPDATTPFRVHLINTPSSVLNSAQQHSLPGALRALMHFSSC